MTGKQDNDAIRVRGAREHNLKAVSVEIPKKKLTVFTGVSGSGKSSLVFDTIAAESQRQLNETFSSFARHRLPHYGQPDADSIENLSAAIVVDQKRLGGNARSTVGTATDIYSLLRLFYSRIGKPFVGESTVFSFNHPEGMCPRCHGLGSVEEVDVEALLDRTKSLNEGAIRFPGLAVGSARWKRYTLSGLFDNDKKLRDYSEREWDLLLNAKPFKPRRPKSGWWASSKYEGLIPRFHRSFLGQSREKTADTHGEALNRFVRQGPCPACSGARLNRNVLRSRIAGKNIAQCAALQAGELRTFLSGVSSSIAGPVQEAILERLEHLVGMGLGYLSLDRQTSTLSGGESQRVKMVKHLGSSLTDMLYIFDEPSIGLHARDVHQVNELLKRLRDKGNTVLVVEHDPDVIAVADHIIDMGPRAGRHGGQVVFQGTHDSLLSAGTLTGRCLARRPELKTENRQAQGVLPIRNASLHNLKKVSVDIPKGIMTVVTGVAGSGKSSLINGVFSRRYPETICIDQGALTASRRSNTASYTGLLDPIRALFANANGVSRSLFSANSEGACPACDGLGTTRIDLAFMDSVESTCEVCGGRKFTAEVLRHTLRGKNIDDVLRLSASEAREFFVESDLRTTLDRLIAVGLGYMSLGQPLSTLSGGERQRIKLATELEKSGQIYVLDEPTTGLHMSDIDRLLKLINRLVDNGSTVLVIEHNLDVIAQADWVIDMGPGAGRDGGRVIFEGTPARLVQSAQKTNSATGAYLYRYLERRSNSRIDSSRQIARSHAGVTAGVAS
jgi:excinuclease UvrABC ATPase subunit